MCSDAPVHVLLDRTVEATVGWLGQRRQQYLQPGTVLPEFVVAEAARPVNEVTGEVAAVHTNRIEVRKP